jgi:uncharacterized protein YecT (DUF1311 family)
MITMKNITLIITCILLYVSVGLAQTQAAMNNDAGKAYKEADKKLNEVYQKILKQYSANALFIKKMKAAQKIWLQFRDAQLEMKYPEREAGYYGSMLPLCKANYLEELTKARTKQLEEWLNNPEEGDACAGTVGENK